MFDKVKLWSKESSKIVNNIFAKSPILKKEDIVDQLYNFSEEKGVYPLHERLPYRVYDEKMGIYENTNSIAFMKELNTLTGVNEKTLVDLLRFVQELPSGNNFYYELMFTGNNKIYSQLANNADAQSYDETSKARAEQQRMFYEMVSGRGFYTRGKNQSQWFDIKDYRLFLAVSYKAKNNEVNKTKLREIETQILSVLENIGLYSRNIQELEFITFINNIINHEIDNTKFPRVSYNPNEFLNRQCILKGTKTATPLNKKDHLDISFDDQHNKVSTLVLKDLPEMETLYNFTEKLASTSNVGKSLRCPFIFKVAFQVEDKITTDSSINSKVKNVKKNAADRLNANEEINDFMYVQKKQTKLVWMVNTLILISRPEDHLANVQAAESLFQGYKALEMIQTKLLLMTLPFTGINQHKTLNKYRIRHRVTAFNLVNFMPLIGEWSGTPTGVMMLGEHNQLSFLNHFGLGTSNYNGTIVAKPGSGKSVLLQLLLDFVLSQGNKAYILDNGESHQKFTQIRGGSYIGANNIKVNPFKPVVKQHLIDAAAKTNDANSWRSALEQSLEGVAILILIMIDNRGDYLNPVQVKAIRNVVFDVYEEKEHEATIDDIYAKLKILKEEHPGDSHYKDLPLMLKEYTTEGQYGEYFIGENNLDEHKNLHCIELKAGTDNIRPIIVFSMLLFIGQQVFRGDRNRFKAIVIEEFRLFQHIKHSYVKESMEKYILEVRKYNAGIITITQAISHYYENEFMQQFYELADIKYILEQEPEVTAKMESGKIGGFSKYEIEKLKTFRPSRDYGFSSILVKRDKASNVMRLFLSPEDKILTTTHGQELGYLQDLRNQGLPLNEQINKAAWNFYPDDMQRFEDYKSKYYGEANEKA